MMFSFFSTITPRRRGTTFDGCCGRLPVSEVAVIVVVPVQDPATVVGSVGSDPLSRDLAGNVTYDISVGVILVNRKSPGVTVVAPVQDDLFLQIGGTNENRPSGVPAHRKVIELVGKSPGALPHTHAEVARYGGT